MSNDEVELIFQETTTDNGLFCQFDDHNGVLLLDIKNPLSTSDFEVIDSIIDPFFKARGELKGIIIHSKKFPYWKGARNRREYTEFAGNNHFKFKKVALSMGGFFPKLLLKIAHGRVHPEMKLFKHNRISQAQDWILE